MVLDLSSRRPVESLDVEKLGFTELGKALDEEYPVFNGAVGAAITKHKITGRVFLSLNHKDWTACGLTFGAARELEQLRDRLLKAKQDFVRLAESVHAKIMSHENLDDARLGDLNFFTVLTRPVVSLDQMRTKPTFEYMGRDIAPRVESFIMNSLLVEDGQPRAVDAPCFAVITGTAGSGKTTCVMASVVNMHRRFAKAREKNPVPPFWAAVRQVLQRKEDVEADGEEQENAKEDDADGDEVGAEEENQDSYCRIVYVDCSQFVNDPFETLRNSLLLAYIDDKQDMQDILAAEGFDDLQQFIGTRSAFRDRLYVVVDEVNATDLDDDDDGSQTGIRKHSVAKRRDARDKVCGLQHVCCLVVCVSVTSGIRKDLRHDKRPAYIFICGGYEARELCKYLEHQKLQLSVKELVDLMWWTGFVPRLVYLYLFGGMEQVVGDLKRYKNWVRAYIGTAKSEGGGKNQLMKALWGEEIWKLSRVLDSRCFYQGPNGRVRCLVPALRPYVMAFLAKTLKEEREAVGRTEIDKWTARIMSDTNMARIGWSAEMATILAAEFHRPHLMLENGEQVVVDPEVVVTGKFAWDILQKHPNKRVLIIPEEFNHLGADMCYVAGGLVVVIQVSVATNAIRIHSKTRELAGRIFRELAEKSAGSQLLLAWVVHGETWEKGGYGDGYGYGEVVCTFGGFSSALKAVDERCDVLKGRVPRKKEDSCVECSEYQCYFGEGELDEWVQCGVCKCWVHILCAGERYTGPQNVFHCLFCDATAGSTAVGIASKKRGPVRSKKRKVSAH